ncbi:efflux RND transporter periplasmic adaptor subunit [Paucibacter sp. DJ2R-2]|uniref:efflux RND transporter periplasmic adaptor subunit n=1 Tax=Paucibacter sp. DJ2R-2 TaxID=2893558 RepID=UPI0021E46093|nr:efflux RND transporter periplasmic adaptor subunit [Paucibacter sp. DJ2R-2]MCV2423590.1 efflux RND transporter periplasmic adaptor subunit [Paucibacter sp. DJ4R-1]MCV2441407.1 efflux RND transporter periplasmic adaptor subunit [Paucibacter sp. DJ2R-2]
MPHLISRRTSQACAVALLALLGACSKQEAAPEPERAVRTLVLQAGTSGQVHEFAGEVRARTETRLSFRVGGKLLGRKVNVGDRVQAGQVLAVLDPQDLVLGQQAAKAGLQAARANRDQLGAELKRFIELQQQGFISAAELERRDLAFKAAQAQLEQARTQSEAQNNQVGYAQLTADAAGVVTAVFVEPGMVVGAGTPVLQLAHEGPRDVVFSVPEDQLGRLREGAALAGGLTVRLWSDVKPGAQAAAEARPISLREVAAATDPVTRTFLIKADAGKLDARIGQTAAVLLASPRVAQAIKLPLSAVLQTQGQTSVWVLDAASMTVKQQPVQVGGADGNEVLVAAGLQPGQEVVVAGVHVLKAGQKVRRFEQGPALPATAPAPAPAAAASR